MKRKLLFAFIWLALFLGLGVGFGSFGNYVEIELWEGDVFRGEFLSYYQGNYRLKVQGEILHIDEEGIRRLSFLKPTGGQTVSGKLILDREPRLVKCQIFGDYYKDTPIKADIVTLNAKPVTGESVFPPGQYQIKIQKEGYQIIDDTISIPPGSEVFFIHRFLSSEEREVIFKIRDSGTSLSIMPDEILLDGHPFQNGGKVKPQPNYHLLIKRPGSHIFSEKIAIPPGSNPYVIEKYLKPTPRQVIFEFHGEEKPDKLLTPDRVSLSSKIIWDGESIPPGKYDLSVEKRGYFPIRDTILIPSDAAPFTLYGKLSSIPRKVSLLVIGFKGNPLTPQHCTLDGKDISSHKYKAGEYLLRIVENGYHDYETKVIVPSGEETYEIPENIILEPKPRKINIDISQDVPQEDQNYSNYSPSLIRSNSKIEIPLHNGIEVDPGEYVLYLLKPGYITHSEPITITTDEEPYEIKYCLVSSPRMFSYRFTADFSKGVNIEPDSIILDDEKFENKSRVKPGIHSLRILKDGYSPLETKIFIKASNKEYLFTGTLKALPRNVNFSVTGWDTRKITPDSMTLDGKSINQEQIYTITPGEYILKISHKYYQNYEGMVIVPPGSNVYNHSISLTPLSREVSVKIKNEFEPNKEIVPDFISINGEIINPANFVKRPGSYLLVIKQNGYRPLVKCIQIPTGEGQYTINEQLISKDREIIFDIKTDFPNEITNPTGVLLGGRPLLNKEAVKPGVYQVRIYKRGYTPKWMRVNITPSEEPFYLKGELNSISRLVIFEIISDFNSSPIQPDIITLNNENVTGKKNFLPGRYVLNIMKEGYKSIKRNIVIPPDDFPYFIYEKLQILPREVKFEFTGEFPVGISIVPQSILIEGSPYDGEKLKPGKYEIQISHPGYFPIKEYIVIPPGKDVYQMSRILCTKPIKVYKDISLSPPDESSRECKVTLSLVSTPDNLVIINDGDEIKPGNYILSISKDGYYEQRWEVCIWPSEKPFRIKKVLTAKLVTVFCKLSYDILPLGNISPSITLIERDGGTEYFYHLSSSVSKVMPGDYELVIDQPGYKICRKRITISLSEPPVEINEQLFANPRNIALQVFNKGKRIIPYRITINGAPFNPDELFSPGKWIEVRAFFYEHPEVKAMKWVPPGEGPYEIRIRDSGSEGD